MQFRNQEQQVSVRVGKHKLAGKYRFGSGPVNTNWGPGLVNANQGPGSVNTIWEPEPWVGTGGQGLGQSKEPGAGKYKYSFLSSLLENVDHIF